MPYGIIKKNQTKYKNLFMERFLLMNSDIYPQLTCIINMSFALLPFSLNFPCQKFCQLVFD